jgi:hypothetical protein
MHNPDSNNNAAALHVVLPKRRGRHPCTGSADTQHATLRIPRDMYNVITALAEKETRTINGQVLQLVKEALAARQTRGPARE